MMISTAELIRDMQERIEKLQREQNHINAALETGRNFAVERAGSGPNK